jgi:hypothetical protein
MSCGCGTGHPAGQASTERIDEAAAALGLRGVFIQSRELALAHGSALSYLQKARRAETLGYAEEIANLYRRAAAREAAQGVRQINAMIARIDTRTSQPDWNDLLEQTAEVFREQGGTAVVEEVKERLRMDLLELDSISPDLAAAALDIGNHTFDAISDEGLNGAIQRLREGLSGEMRLFGSLVDADPANATTRAITQPQIICITVAVAMAAIALISCMFIPLCFCCLTPLFAGILALQLAACAIFAGK